MKQSGEIDTSGIKRCRVGITIIMSCPRCNEEIESDMSLNYLSYPTVGDVDTTYFYCKSCEHEFELPIKITKTELEIEYEEKDIYEV